MFYYVTHACQGQDTSKAQDTQEQCIAEVLVIAYTNTSPACQNNFLYIHS